MKLQAKPHQITVKGQKLASQNTTALYDDILQTTTHLTTDFTDKPSTSTSKLHDTINTYIRLDNVTLLPCYSAVQYTDLNINTIDGLPQVFFVLYV